MRLYRPMLFALLPLFASCQVFTERSVDPGAHHTRLQGEISHQGDQLLLRPCQEQRRFVIEGTQSDLAREAAPLFAAGATQLFADVRGQLGGTPQAGVDGSLDVSRVYQLNHEGPGCEDPNFKRLLIQASGHEPDWQLNASGRGLVLNRPGQAPLALPYLEEQLPDGRLNLTSEANGQRLELWAAPGRCVDSMSGNVQHLTAELRLDGQVMRGCAHFGGARND
ncbi:MAG: hypothetical protein KJ884_17350 [Gammaproteobacteria bacterium]|nr:hypothetical protein [Gammaproteobacteria bacterium]MBU1488635.1 hypothetical protein [Gammaproteobacteria bacterium]MBU2064760.1 hypothetical protein [Gammaproteobacteria bacterium]MBU2139446.1 hypothetical protein [Gammaproteobacteria bacterium]MBU2218212.1 hypothetical protein [Gammaproteobacteria bacterium]